MLITELFSSDVKGTIIFDDKQHFKVDATIEGRVISFLASRNNENEWDVMFVEKGQRGTATHKTGSGGELKVFSFVMECLRELVKRKKPTLVSFTSSKGDENRTSLYQKMAKRYTPKGYKLETFSHGDTDFFNFFREET